MARPTTKKELLDAANQQYIKLLALINSIREEEQRKEFSFNVEQEKEAHWKRDKNMRDVLVHVYEWHLLFLSWVNSNKNSIPKQFLLEGYNWKTYGDMNMEFWRKHQSTSYEDAKKSLQETHLAVIALIETFSDEELFQKSKLTWSGGSTLGSYCTSVTSSHYDWAMKKLKKHIHSLK